MMRMKFGSLADWETFDGKKVFALGDGGVRALRFSGVTEGASITVSDESGVTLVFSGGGNFDVDCGVVGDVTLHFDAEGLTSLRIEGVKPRDVGWKGDPSYTDLEPKSFGTLTPEVQALFEMMQRNMLAREARLISELKKS